MWFDRTRRCETAPVPRTTVKSTRPDLVDDRVRDVRLCRPTRQCSSSPDFVVQLTSWDAEFCERLAAGGRYVIRFDNRDCGLSTKLDGVTADWQGALHASLTGAADAGGCPYTLSDMANDGVGLLDALEIDAAHVVGASMGGMIAQTMAIEHPDRVRSLTSIMSSPGDPRTGKPEPEALEVLLTVPPTRARRLRRRASTHRGVGVQALRRHRAHPPASGGELRPQLLSRGRAAPAGRDLRQRRSHHCPWHARRPDPRHPRTRRHVDHAGRRHGDGRGDPRRTPSARRRHGPRPAACRCGR